MVILNIQKSLFTFSSTQIYVSQLAAVIKCLVFLMKTSSVRSIKE